jgi:hypothetical protein
MTSGIFAISSGRGPSRRQRAGSMMLAASMPNQAPMSWLRPIWPSRLAFLSFWCRLFGLLAGHRHLPR